MKDKKKNNSVRLRTEFFPKSSLFLLSSNKIMRKEEQRVVQRKKNVI